MIRFGSAAIANIAGQSINGLIGQRPFGIITPQEFGAKGDGATDDTQALQNLFNSAGDGSIIYFPDSGPYICNGVTITGKNLIIIGNNTVITRTMANKIFDISNADYIKIHNLVIDGANHKEQSVFIVNIANVECISMISKNNGIPGYSSGNNGSFDGIYIRQANFVVIKNCICEGNERDGVHTNGCDAVIAYKNILKNNGRYGIVVDMTYGNPTKSYLSGNYCYDCKSGGIHSETGDICRIRFTNNLIIDCGNDNWGYGSGISVGNGCLGIITDNIVENYGALAIDKTYSHGICVGAPGGPITIKGNIINNSGEYGVYINACSDKVNIIGNQILNSGQDGVNCYNSPNTIISNNFIQLNKNNGIYVNLSSNTLIANNYLKNNSQEAINTYSAIKSRLSQGHSIIGNKIIGNSHKYGIEFDNVVYVPTCEISCNNIDTMGTAWNNFAEGYIKGEVKQKIKHYYGTALPSTGTWNVGDIIWNTSPMAGGNMGWVCVSGGTPGTWKAFGAIDA